MRKYNEKLDLKWLRHDLDLTLGKNSFKDSHHKHSVSLLTEDITPDSHITFHNNLPFSNHKLSETSYFHHIWNLFSDLSEVTCFRIMEKLPNTAYGLHNDKDAGDILRFQIPIYTNSDCWLALTTFEEIEEGWTPDNSYFKKDILERFQDNVEFYQLKEGYLYHFNTNYIHTLTNEGDTPRYTLLIDVKKNDKILNFINKKFTPQTSL